MKKFLSVFLTIALVLALSAPAFAADMPTEKEEVVYGILGMDGRVQSIYVVNSFLGGKITDYGNYRAVSNMTTSENLTKSGSMITINTKADRFYYQGTLESKALPWDITIKYKLDGKEISATELAGKNGELAITLSTSQNKTVNPAFYENYMLQISLALDTEKCTEIVSPNAAIANAGKVKIIVHTVMPGSDADILVEAKVQDFAMSEIEITAMPLSMSIEVPEIDGLTEDMELLADAVSALNEGVKELAEGTAKTYSGADNLTAGSSSFAMGLSALSDNSGEMLNGSAQIKDALANIAGSLEGGSGIDLGGLSALPGGLRRLAAGLTEIKDGMDTLEDGYSQAYGALDSAISAIPDADIDPTGLYGALAGDPGLNATLDQLMGYYAAAKTVKGTYAQVQAAFAAVSGTLITLSASIDTISGTLSEMANEIQQSLRGADIGSQIRQLQDGLSQLSDNYDEFHAGLGEYTRGVIDLSAGYTEVHTGLKSLTGGIGELNTGAKDLRKGTNKLNDAVSDLPDTMEAEIDKLTSQYNKADFEPVSFVSAKNTKVTLVQFVLKTTSIELPEEQEPTVEAPVKLTFWQKLLKLFGLYHEE